MRCSRAAKYRLRRRRLFAEPLEPRRLLAADFGELLPALPTDTGTRSLDLLPCSHGDHAGDEQRLFRTGKEGFELAALDAGSGTGSGDGLQQSTALHPISSIPVLNSLPGAPKTLYLDFDGHFEAQWGSYSNLTTPVYDADGDPTSFSDTELAFIRDVWLDVAEDFAPFNINVTTVEPPELGPGVPPSTANGKALRIAIGGKYTDWYGAAASGVGYVNTFTNSIPNVVYTFADGETDAQKFAYVSSHEAGHGFGLQHRSGQNFVTGHIDIMSSLNLLGLSYSTWNVGVNSNGEYQDDMAIIAGAPNNIGYRADDHGNTLATATPLAVSSSGAVVTGVVTTVDDIDVFSLASAPAGSFLFSLDGNVPNQNLDAVLELRDASGNVLLIANPEDSLDASLIGGTPGVAYVAVRSTGEYGRVGQYTLTLTPPDPGVQLGKSRGPLTTSEAGGSEAITLALSARPTANVTFELASSDPTEATVSTNQVTFTPENWFIPQAVVITGQTDGITDGAAGYAVSISPSISADPAYDNTFDPEDLQLVNLDDVPGGLYWLTYNQQWFGRLHGSSLAGDNAEMLVDIGADFPPLDSGYLHPSDIAVDPIRGKLYWTDVRVRSIYRTNLDGSSPEIIYSTSSGELRGISIDAAAGKLYWINTSKDTIHRANLDGSGVETLISEGLGTLVHLRLDLDAGKMYWNDTQSRTVNRANLDGSGVEVAIESDGVHRITVFNVDTENDKIYFFRNTVPPHTITLHRANLDGTNEEFLLDVPAALPGIGAISDLVVDAKAGRLYWPARVELGSRLFSANLDGSLIATIADSTDGYIAGMAMLHPTPGVMVSPSSGLVTTESGDSATFSVVLLAPPAADVTIPVASSNPGEGTVSTSSLVFTPENWSEPQLVVVTGADEMLRDGDIAYSIDLGPTSSSDASYHALDVQDVSITNLDNDMPLFADSFEVGEWNGLWGEDSQNRWFRSSQRSTDGGYSAQFSGSANNAALTMADSVDLTPYSGAELSFSWFIASSFDKNEYLAVDIFNGAWREVARLRGNDDQENVWHHETIQIQGADLVPNFKIRFRAKSNDSTEVANVDNVLLVPTGMVGPPNQLPTAVAGGPYTSSEGSPIALSGAGSFDSDGTIVAYDWDYDGDGQYDDASGSSPTFVTNQDGVHQVHLRVTDNRGGTATASATITVANVAPTASAGGPYAMNEGGAVTLSAAASSDPGQDIVSYAWDFDGDGQYDDATGVSPVFSTTIDGVYTLGLRVTDHRGATSTASTTVTVSNVAPTANAGGPYSGFVDETIVLSATASTDPGQDIVSYAWDLDGDGQYDDATGASVVFTRSVPNNYPVSVRVTDNDGASSTASTIVEIADVLSDVVVFADSFEVGEWNGIWVEDSQNDWFRSSQRSTDGTRSAEVAGNTNNAALTMASGVDLTPYTFAELSFSWYIASSFDNNEYLAVDVYNGHWREVARLRGNVDQEGVWHHETIQLGGTDLVSDFKIRFRAKANDSTEHGNVDHVRIIATGATPSALRGGRLAYLSDPVFLSGRTSSLASDPAVHDSVMESIGETSSGDSLDTGLWAETAEEDNSLLSSLADAGRAKNSNAKKETAKTRREAAHDAILKAVSLLDWGLFER